ncbi:hypothetical protein F8B43_4190 [Methylorubrum populi]|uniref:Uncharacterized protein n=1 Tax=Methylorubrum populi TaxID=223967 RepID=A0A833J3W8_9HYPH|nr:hypothetical protein F8B43_4190 [Methylorubrum populi]
MKAEPNGWSTEHVEGSFKAQAVQAAGRDDGAHKRWLSFVS